MSFSSSISSFDEQSDGHLFSLIDVSLHYHLCLLTLVLSFVCLQFKRDFTGQLFRSMKRFIDYVVFSPCESNFPASARRYWRRIDVGVCPVQFSGVCHPPSKGVCLLQFLKPLTPRIKGLQRCNDTMKECRILRKGLICTYSIFIYGWRIGVRHIFFRISGRSISNAVGKIICIRFWVNDKGNPQDNLVFIGYRLERTSKSLFFRRTLIRNDWYQIVDCSEMLTKTLGFVIRCANWSLYNEKIATHNFRIRRSITEEENKGSNHLLANKALKQASSTSLLSFIIFNTWCINLLM